MPIVGECLPFSDGGTFDSAFILADEFASAGLGALRCGRAPILRRRAWQPTSVFGKSLRKAEFPRVCREYDLILTMERLVIAALCDIAPEMRGKVMLFGHWDGEREIPDPYHKSRDAFEAAVYTLLEGFNPPVVAQAPECRGGKTATKSKTICGGYG